MRISQRESTTRGGIGVSLRSLRRHPDRDLAAAATLTMAAVAAVVLPIPVSVRAVVIAVFVLSVPGYAVVQVLGGGAHTEPAEQALLSIGTSLGIAIAGGLLLSLTPAGIQASTWMWFLGGASLVAIVIAWLRRKAGPSRAPMGPSSVPPLRRMDVVGLGAAIVVALGSVTFGRAALAEPDAAIPHQLWIVPNPEDRESFVVGMQADLAGGDYTVRVASADVVLEEFALSLAPGETWQTAMPLDAASGGGPIVATLRTQASTSDSRRVVLYPSATPP